MPARLLVAVLANRHAGKSTTWNRLFGRDVKTGKVAKRLNLNKAQWVEAFLVYGSPQERNLKVQKIVANPLPQIVLCSVQYRQDATETFDFFFARGYETFVQWLNPGYKDAEHQPDALSLREYLLDRGATLQIRDGKTEPEVRVREIRQFILGWARHRDLIATDFPA